MIKKVLKKNGTYIVILAILTVICAVFTGLFYVPYFTSNDDLLLRSIMSGVYTGTPSAYLIYIMYPLGLVFKALYTMLPNVAWYELFTFSAHFVCIFLISARLDAVFFAHDEKFRKYGYLRLVLSAAFFFVIYSIHLRYTIENQYTVLAGLLAATSLFYFSTFSLCESKKEYVLCAVITLVTFALSLWLRKEVCFMILPLFLLSLVSRMISGIIKHKKIGQILILSGIILVILLLSILTHKAAYNKPEWKEFEAFNKARTDVYDYGLMPAFSDNKDFYESLGVEVDEYTAFTEYTLNLTDRADSSNFETMALRQKSIQKEWEKYYSVPKKIIKDTFASFKEMGRYYAGSTAFIFGVTAFLVGLFVWIRQKNALPFLVIMASVIYFAVFTAYFTYLNRLPDRVFVPFLYALLVVFVAEYVFIVQDNGFAFFEGKKSRLFSVIFAIFAAVVLLLTSWKSAGRNQNYYAAKTEDFNEINSYIEKHPDNVYMITQSVNATQCKSLFNGYYDPVNSVRTVDWCYQSPLMKEKYQILGIEDSAYSLRNKNVYILMAEFVNPQYAVNLVNKDGEWTEAVKTDEIKAGNTIVNVWKMEVVR